MAGDRARPVTLPKRGGYTGGPKPASGMRPPVKTPASGYGTATPERSVPANSPGRDAGRLPHGG